MKIRDAITKFLSNREDRDCNAGTLQTYRSQLNLLATWMEGRRAPELADLSPDLLAQFVADMKTRPKKGGDAPMSKITVRKRTKSIRTFLMWCEHAGYVAPIAHCVPVPRKSRHLPKALTLAQVEALFSVDMSAKDRAALSLMYDAGPRLAEVCGLNTSDLDLDAGTAYIQQGKGDADRYIVFGDITTAALRAWLCERETWLIPAKPTRAVFVNQYGERSSPDAMYRAVKAVATRAGLGEEVRPHVLRHSFATHAHDRDASLLHIKEQLGHADIQTTMIYTYASVAKRAERHKDYSPLAHLAKNKRA